MARCRWLRPPRPNTRQASRRSRRIRTFQPKDELPLQTRSKCSRLSYNGQSWAVGCSGLHQTYNSAGTEKSCHTGDSRCPWRTWALAFRRDDRRRRSGRTIDPRSVALIGATSRPGSVGVVVARNLGRAGVAGEFAAGDPHSRAIDGMSVYANIAGLPRALDLAVIAAARDCGASDQRTEPAWHARVRSHYHRLRREG